MSLHLVNPADTDDTDDGDQAFVPPSGPDWRARLANAAYILLAASGFLASTYLMTLGLPLLFFLLLSGGSAELFFAQVANLADRFLAADAARQAGFAQDLALGLVALATLVAALRLPTFLAGLGHTCREENL